MMDTVISVKNLVKEYKDLRAVNNVSFEVLKGEIFGLLGENGAGKTTTLEMIEGIRKPTSGTIKVLGLEIKKEMNKIKGKIGVQLQSSAYYNYLSLKEILELFGQFYGKEVDALKLLEMVDLSYKANSYVGKLSGGQKQRFSIIASLVNDPEIVFLDEPTTGLDPLARRNLWELIAKIKDQGKTIILTTHYLEEAEVLCDRVAIMEKGEILKIDETHKLIESSKEPYKISFYAPKIKENALKQLENMGRLSNLGGKTNHFEMRLKTQTLLNIAISIIHEYKPESLTVGRSTLEDLFIELTGKRIEE